MSNIRTLILLLIYIIFVPIIIDKIFDKTTRNPKKIICNARKKSRQPGKAFIIFNGLDGGVIYNYQNNSEKKEEFTGPIDEILPQLMTNSAVIVLAYALEYSDNPTSLIKEIKRVSGGQFYVIGYELNAHRSLWDYEIKQDLLSSYYCPNQLVQWVELDQFTLAMQNVYKQISKILPFVKPKKIDLTD